MTPLVPFVYGEEFERSKMVIILLFLGIIFASIGKVSCSYFVSHSREPKIHLYITGIILSINILLNLF